MNLPLMQGDDLMSTDSRAIGELQGLYRYFIQASDAHLQNANNIMPRNLHRRGRASILALASAYEFAAGDVADSLKRLGHKPCLNHNPS